MIKSILNFFRGSKQKSQKPQRQAISCLKNPKPEQNSSPFISESAHETSLVLPPKKPEEQTIDDLWDILESVPTDDPEYQEAFRAILKIIDSLEDFNRLYDTIGDEKSSLIPSLIEELEKIQESFDAWLETYSNREDLDDYSDFLLTKAISLADSTENWINLWEAAENSHEEDLATARTALSKMEWPKEKWEELRDDTTDGDIENFAFVRLLQFYQTVPEIIDFYLEYEKDWTTDEDVTGKIFEKLFSLTTRQEAQLISRLTEHDDLREAADKFLMS